MREQRKVVTVLFCDVVGSTALGESTDPEALRARMRRYFEDLRSIVERHGGTVEKFVGDAVMAVFGIPLSHEDDALRAVRAATEMRVAIAEHGLEARIGVNTGEVVVGGEGETLVTGDAVNVAARLEQAAASGEALIGAETRLLVRDAVVLEAVEPLSLKGKSEPVEAYRLLEVISDAAPLARHLETPLVGRERERRRLWRDYEDAVADRTCRLFTLLGPAGIGKSRLVADFLDRVGNSADVLRGRCLPYGEGITYWPLVEMLIAIGVDPDTVIGTSPPETQLAFRRLLEARAEGRPQVVVIDDLQWAEPVFVDLVEHVADLSRDAPIFLLCVARTELLDIRPGWAGGKVNATSLLLEPLGEEDCATLMEYLGEGRLDDALRARITAASAGNPLYVEEMLAMVREHGGDGEVAIPPTIHALLQARIDSLDGDVRVVMERGAVEGEVFHRGSVAELSPDPLRSDVGTHLATLVRKELIRSTSPTFPEDEGFRFRHLLIRDAAYESLPKATRAELHERFADWLSTHDLVERDEIVGYHFEQAHRYRAELDRSDQSLPALATRAAEHLDAAGRRALGRGDHSGGRSLLRRAHALYPRPDERRLALVPELAVAMWESGELLEARVLLDEARNAADPVVAAMASIVDDILDVLTTSSLTREERAARREEARAALEAAGDSEGLALYWWAVAGEAWHSCRTAEAAAACEKGLLIAGGGFTGRKSDLIWWTGGAYVFGPISVVQGIERLSELQESFAETTILAAGLDNAKGRLMAMHGDVGVGRQLHLRAQQTLREAGMLTGAAGASMSRAWIEERAGDLAAAEDALREGMDELERLNDRAYRSTVVVNLAEDVHMQGRLDETRQLCALARELTPHDDVTNLITLHFLEGALLADEGRLDEAYAEGQRAVELSDTTDHFFSRACARLYLAATLARSGRQAEAAALAAEGLAIIRAKGDVTGLVLVQRLIEQGGLALA
jgi:class 3 adenylate cyclase/tetratricopeptide (TPR) repeat protein